MRATRHLVAASHSRHRNSWLQILHLKSSKTLLMHECRRACFPACLLWLSTRQAQARASAREGREAYLVGAGGLIAVTRAEHEDVGHGAEGGQVLDGLVGGAVLAQADAVVGHHEDAARMAQRCHADRRPHVVCMHAHNRLIHWGLENE